MKISFNCELDLIKSPEGETSTRDCIDPIVSIPVRDFFSGFTEIYPKCRHHCCKGWALGWV